MPDKKDARLLKRLGLTMPDNELWKRKAMIAELQEKETEKPEKENPGVWAGDQNSVPSRQRE